MNLTAHDPVPIGMSITIKPMFAFQNKNWYGVYAMYNEGEIVGGYYPDIPVPYHRPPKQHHSVFDEILETAVFVAVMVVVTYFTAGTGDGPAAEFMLGVLGGALGGAAGSIAEQETARALHDQKGFDWNQVGISAAEGAIAGGIGAEVSGLQALKALKGASFGVKFGLTLARGEIAALSSEGLEYAFGITKHFKWSDVVATAASAAVQSGTQYAFGDVSTKSFTQSLYASTINAAGNAVIGKVVYGQDIDVGMVAADSLGTAVGEYVGTKVTETKIAQDAKTKLDKKLQDWFPPKPQNAAQPSIRSTRGSQLPKTAANDDSYGNPLTDHDGVCAWNGQDPLSDSSDSSQGQSSSDSQSQTPTSKRATQSQRTQNKADQWNADRGRTWANKGNPFGSLPGIIPGLFSTGGTSRVPDWCQSVSAKPAAGMTEAQFLICEAGLKMGEAIALGLPLIDSGFFGGSLDFKLAESSLTLDRGVTFFSKDYLHFFAPDTFEGSTTFGLPSKPIFLMPEEDAARIQSPVSVAIETGFAPSVKNAWLQEKEIFGASFPTKGLSLRLPTAEDSGGNINFRPGGNTAIHVPGTDTFLVNQTREFVTPGGIKMPSGTVIFRLGEQGEWTSYWRFK